MLIFWSRWGILIIPATALGVAVGALLAQIVMPGVREGHAYGMFMGLGLILGGLSTYLVDRLLIGPHLDKPRQQFVLEPLPQPVGSQTHRQVPLLNAETGQPVWVKPRSTFFFVPLRIWSAVIITVGSLLLLLSLVLTLQGV